MNEASDVAPRARVIEVEVDDAGHAAAAGADGAVS